MHFCERKVYIYVCVCVRACEIRYHMRKNLVYGFDVAGGLVVNARTSLHVVRISVGTLTEVLAFSISILRLSECQYGTVEHAVTVCGFALTKISQGSSTMQ